jgi:hypothetical protein
MSKNTDKHISLSLPASSPAETAAARPKGIAIKPGQVICGELEMRIDRRGVWHYLGSPIGRKELVRLFSTVLRRDDDGDYWLITPAEVGRITVDDAPFLAVEMTVFGDGDEQIITLRTNMDVLVSVDDAHPIRIDIDPDTNEPSPYLVMDGGIEALITRAVYYELVALGHEKDGGNKKDAIFGVWSSGGFFSLGTLVDKEAGP